MEYELILWRIGIFDNGKVDEMTVCPKHRNLGLSWMPSLSTPILYIAQQKEEHVIGEYQEYQD